MMLWTGGTAGSTVDQRVARTLGTAVLHQRTTHERCQRGAHRSTTTTERWHDNDEEWQWLELSVRVEEGERERESSGVRGKSVGLGGGGPHPFIGVWGAPGKQQWVVNDRH
jgi:hypothetical protein